MTDGLLRIDILSNNVPTLDLLVKYLNQFDRELGRLVWKIVSIGMIIPIVKFSLSAYDTLLKEVQKLYRLIDIRQFPGSDL